MSADTGREPAAGDLSVTMRSHVTSRVSLMPWPNRAAARLLAGLAPVAVAFILGLWQISVRSFSQDEAATLAASRRPLSGLWKLLWHIDAVHGVYYVFIHAVIAIFGSSETAVRLPSVCATAVAAGAIFAGCARISSLTLGLASGLLFAVAPPVTAMSQSARPFALATMLVVISYYWLVRLAESGSRRDALFYCATLVFCGLCDVLTTLVVISSAITLALTPRYRSRLRLFMISAGIAALLLAPAAILEVGQVGQVAWESPPPLPVAIGLVLLTAATGLIIVRFKLGHGISEHAALLMLTVPWLVIPPTVLAVTAQITPMWENRYLLFCAPAVAMLAAVAVSRIRPQGYRIATMILIIGLVLAAQPLVRPTEAPDDLRTVAELIAAKSHAGDAIVFPPQSSELGRRLILAAYPSDFSNLRDIGSDNSQQFRFTLYGRNVAPAVLNKRLADVQRFWLVEFPTQDPPQRYGATVSPYPFCAVKTWQIPGSTVTLYDRCGG